MAALRRKLKLLKKEGVYFSFTGEEKKEEDGEKGEEKTATRTIVDPDTLKPIRLFLTPSL